MFLTPFVSNRNVSFFSSFHVEKFGGFRFFMRPFTSIRHYCMHFHLTRWRFVILSWVTVVCVHFLHNSQHVIVTDPSDILDLAHCHINSVLLRQQNTNKTLGSSRCCPNKTQLELRFSNIHLTPTFYHVYRFTPDVCFGYWQPIDCQSHQNVAVLVPYRDRELHLRLLLARLHQLLQHQRVRYRIYVIEQVTVSLHPRNRIVIAILLARCCVRFKFVKWPLSFRRDHCSFYKKLIRLLHVLLRVIPLQLHHLSHVIDMIRF